MKYIYVLLITLFVLGCAKPDIDTTPPVDERPYDYWDQYDWRDWLENDIGYLGNEASTHYQITQYGL